MCPKNVTCGWRAPHRGKKHFAFRHILLKNGMVKRTTKMIGLALLLAAALGGATLAADGNSPDNIVLSWTQETATTQTFSWRDNLNQTEYVQVVTLAQYRQNGFSDAAQVAAACKDISLDGTGFWHYEATASGLAPATTYRYRVGNENGWSKVNSFATADPGTTSLSFVYMGDIQINSDMTEEYGLWGELAQAAYRQTPDLAFGLLGGDIVESGISAAQFDCFLENAQSVFSQISLMPTNGNHESNFSSGKPELYFDVFALPENGPEGFSEEFYSFDYANCHVLVLNSWIYSGEQALTDEDYASISNWIAQDLAESTADWQIVVTHVPVYEVHSDTTADAVRGNWAQLFEQYGADLVFVGHQHVYSRSYPMYEGAINYQNGVTYIMGNAGQKVYDSADETFSERTVYEIATYQLVRIDGDALTVQTFDIDGNELDYCAVTQRPKFTQLPSFIDVSDAAWYKTAVDYAAIKGVMTGTSETAFSPDMTLSRAQFATILWRMAGCPDGSASSGFSDVESGVWYAQAVNWVSESGLICGYGNGVFGAADDITREQVAAILYRYSGSPTTETTGSSLERFSDASDVSSWALSALKWADEEDIIDGSDGKLNPQGGATRAQAAQILMKFEIN